MRPLPGHAGAETIDQGVDDDHAGVGEGGDGSCAGQAPTSECVCRQGYNSDRDGEDREPAIEAKCLAEKHEREKRGCGWSGAACQWVGDTEIGRSVGVCHKRKVANVDHG